VLRYQSVIGGAVRRPIYDAAWPSIHRALQIRDTSTATGRLSCERRTLPEPTMANTSMYCVADPAIWSTEQTVQTSTTAAALAAMAGGPGYPSTNPGTGNRQIRSQLGKGGWPYDRELERTIMAGRGVTYTPTNSHERRRQRDLRGMEPSRGAAEATPRDHPAKRSRTHRPPVGQLIAPARRLRRRFGAVAGLRPASPRRANAKDAMGRRGPAGVEARLSWSSLGSPEACSLSGQSDRSERGQMWRSHKPNLIEQKCRCRLNKDS